MAKINSRAKGSKGERDVAKWWKEWTGYDFARVPSSGGLRWGRTTDTTGDLICSDQKHFMRFPFSIECKSYKDINFEHILLGNKKCKILEFWNQAVDDAKRGNKLPLLMMRYNGMPKNEYFFIVNEDLADIFTPNHIGRLMTIDTGDYSLSVFMASDILSNHSYPAIYKEAKKLLKNKKNDKA